MEIDHIRLSRVFLGSGTLGHLGTMNNFSGKNSCDVGEPPSMKRVELTLFIAVRYSDGMRRPVSDGMRYAPNISTCSKHNEKETGNAED